MDSFEKFSLENEIFELQALSGRDILNQQSALVFTLVEHDAMHLSLWSSICPRSLGLIGSLLGRFTVATYTHE